MEHPVRNKAQRVKRVFARMTFLFLQVFSLAVDVQAARADLKTASGLVQHGAVDQGLSHIFLYILVIMGYSPLIVVFLVSRFYGSEVGP